MLTLTSNRIIVPELSLEPAMLRMSKHPTWPIVPASSSKPSPQPLRMLNTNLHLDIITAHPYHQDINSVHYTNIILSRRIKCKANSRSPCEERGRSSSWCRPGRPPSTGCSCHNHRCWCQGPTSNSTAQPSSHLRLCLRWHRKILLRLLVCRCDDVHHICTYSSKCSAV